MVPETLRHDFRYAEEFERKYKKATGEYKPKENGRKKKTFKCLFKADSQEHIKNLMDKIENNRHEEKELFYTEMTNEDSAFWVEKFDKVMTSEGRLFLNPDIHYLDTIIFMDIVSSIKKFTGYAFLKNMDNVFNNDKEFKTYASNIHEFMEKALVDLQSC
ncbi:unnamed protein product [Ambrosiozyma monospora]|uniref:Unnamed protein product n=1 Tax=Ambrosiozyma monospora TaxID=43982 RepID=A0ACB5UDT4_AMBMO|nr:unnamed protein product [Ambrosiozyma monospora]